MRYSLRFFTILVGFIVSFLTASGLMASSAAAAKPSFGHVFVIVGENKSLFQLTSSNAPYITTKLRHHSAWFTNYHDVVKGSLPNYIALTSGQYAPCQVTGPCGQFTVRNIFAQVGHGGWRAWNESMPSNCYKHNAGGASGRNWYQAGHNPALYYTGLGCTTYDVPAGTTGRNDMSAFNKALKAGRVPKFNFITPNNCENSHNSCDGGNIVKKYDSFLRREIPHIKASPAFGPHSVIFVTYDEGYRKTNDTNTMMAVIGPQVHFGTYRGRYNHYSTLATIEHGLGVRCVAKACAARRLPIG